MKCNIFVFGRWAETESFGVVMAGTDPQALEAAKGWMGNKATFRARSRNEFASFLGFQILARKTLANDRVELKYQFGFQNSSTPQEIKLVEMV